MTGSNMRKGPLPLSAHIGIATSYLQQQNEGAPAEDPAIVQALEGMMAGISAYQAHGFYAEKRELAEVFRSGTVSLLEIPDDESSARCATDPQYGCVVLVPSLINRAGILDLMEGRSLMRWLAAQGLKVFLLDWGDVQADVAQHDLDVLITRRLIPAFEYLQAQGHESLHALGYCMGGTLMVGAVALRPDLVQSLSLLAAPWDFHAGAGRLLNQVKFWMPSVQSILADKDILPAEWLQILFAAMDPALSIRKFSRFAKMDPASEEARIFVTVEDWLNDGVALPSPVAQRCITEWFLENRTAAGSWQVSGHTIEPRHIEVPCHIISSRKDRLVEWESAAALVDVMRQAEAYDTGCGHIGMIAGSQAVENVWAPIADWIKKQAS